MTVVSYIGVAHKFEVKAAPAPEEVGNDEVLVKVTACGICGSDKHLFDGALVSAYPNPLVPGHEVVGVIAKWGKDVRGFAEGDRVVLDPLIFCQECFHCHRREPIHCEKLGSLGWTKPGGYGEHVVISSSNVYKIPSNVSDEEATLIEPLSNAVHVLEQIELKPGSEVLVLGAGPSGVMISQLCKASGASRVVLASNAGMKMDVAKRVGTAHEYLELDRQGAEEQWEAFRKSNPRGFDCVIEATGSVKLANEAISYVRRKGTLCLYGLYLAGQLQVPLGTLVRAEIKLVGCFAQNHTFPRAIEYVESGKINLKGLISHVYHHHEFQDVLERLDERQVMKIALKP